MPRPLVLFGVQVIVVALDLIEAKDGGQVLITFAEVVRTEPATLIPVSSSSVPTFLSPVRAGLLPETNAA